MLEQWQDKMVDVIGGVSKKIEMLKAADFEPKTIIMNSADAMFVRSLCNRYHLQSLIPEMKLFGLPVVIREVDEIQVGV